MAQVDVAVDSRIFGWTGLHKLQFEVDVFKIALGLIGAIVVVVGALIWRTQIGSTRSAHQSCRSGAGPRSGSPAEADAEAETDGVSKEHQPAQ
jgi:hypothetical protein